MSLQLQRMAIGYFARRPKLQNIDVFISSPLSMQPLGKASTMEVTADHHNTKVTPRQVNLGQMTIRVLSENGMAIRNY